MYRLLFVLLFFICTCNIIVAQEIIRDTLSIDSVHITLDTLKNDTLQLIQKQDQDTIKELADTVAINSFVDTSKTGSETDTIINIQKDSVLLKEIIPESKDYQQFINFTNDSLFFGKPDTLHYVVYNLNNLILKDTLILNDTLKQAIQKLIDYSTNSEIDTVIGYLNHNLDSSFLDKYEISYTDSLYNAVKFLMESIPEDSINLAFTNVNSDSVLFKVSENEIDSIRLNLYDNRGEYATLWIKKSDLNVFDIYLEDGIYIEKARTRKVVNQRLDSNLKIPPLKKVRKVEKIIAIWDFDGSADVKFNQGYFSKSWSEGGESSISALSVFKYSADHNYGKKRNLDTDVEYRLGYIQAGDNDLRKNDDRFEINAKYGRTAFNNWYYSALLNFKTQLFKGKEYPNDSTVNVISEFLSPAYLVFSLGLDYKPSKKLTILISPVTSKFTIVADTVNYDQTRFGVGQDEHIRKEIGAYIKAISKLKFRDNISLENKINFFTNYTDKPQNIDVDWEVDLKVKLTDYINMSVNAHFIHDDNVSFIDEDGSERGARPQFKELFGIGFTYTF